MATKEELERRFLTAIDLTPQHPNYFKLAVQVLAREVAAALAEVAQPRGLAEAGPVIQVIASGPPKRSAVDIMTDPAPMLEWKAATPPPPAPQGEVMTAMEEFMGEVQTEPTLWTQGRWRSGFVAAARADQRAAVRAACAPLRERIAELAQLAHRHWLAPRAKAMGKDGK
jgi:hypothetical protein